MNKQCHCSGIKSLYKINEQFFSESWLSSVCLWQQQSTPGTVWLGWLRQVRKRTEDWESRSSSPDTFIRRPPPNSQGRSSYAGKGQGRQAWTCRWHKYIHILSVHDFIILPQEINLETLNTEGYLKAWSCQGHRQRLLHTTGPEARHPSQNNDSSSSFPWQ